MKIYRKFIFHGSLKELRSFLKSLKARRIKYCCVVEGKGKYGIYVKNGDVCTFKDTFKNLFYR